MAHELIAGFTIEELAEKWQEAVLEYIGQAIIGLDNPDDVPAEVLNTAEQDAWNWMRTEFGAHGFDADSEQQVVDILDAERAAEENNMRPLSPGGAVLTLHAIAAYEALEANEHLPGNAGRGSLITTIFELLKAMREPWMQSLSAVDRAQYDEVLNGYKQAAADATETTFIALKDQSQ